MSSGHRDRNQAITANGKGVGDKRQSFAFVTDPNGTYFNRVIPAKATTLSSGARRSAGLENAARPTERQPRPQSRKSRGPGGT